VSDGATPGRKLNAIQVLRALAAFVVVLGHVSGAVRHHPELFRAPTRVMISGGAGVDVFFLLSGFIMVFSSDRMFGSVAGSRDFIIRRLVRIVPFYWAVTVLAISLAALGNHGLPKVPAIAASFAFVPFDTAGRGDGFAFPIVDLGWTLNYEMLFYLVFALFLPLGRSRCVLGVALAMALLVAVGHVFDPAPLPLRFWTRPIILEFVTGMLVALAYRHGLGLSPAVRLLAVAAAIALLLVDPLGISGAATTENGFARVLGWGGPATLLLIAAISGKTPLASLPARIIVLLGDASYALYLLHPFVILVLVRLAAMPLFPDRGGTLFMIVTLLAVCFTAMVAHKVVERPVTRWLTRLLQRHSAPIKAMPLPPDARLTSDER
jgi:exopolysaccharide production protein ExoZ